MIVRGRRLIVSEDREAWRPIDAWRWPRCRSEVASVTGVVAVVDIAWSTHARVRRVATIGYHTMRLA